MNLGAGLEDKSDSPKPLCVMCTKTHLTSLKRTDRFRFMMNMHFFVSGFFLQFFLIFQTVAKDPL